MNQALPKVSLISPCFNGESYLPHFLSSLCAQTYKNVEFIFVNDGSTDKTEEVFNSYKPKLEENGWTVIYIRQDNAGQAAAINQGLKIFSGDYLICPDSDDILYPEHIAEKVAYMEEHPAFGMAYCNVDYVNENDLDDVLYTRSILSSVRNKQVFGDIITDKNVLWEPIGNIMRTSVFLEVNPERRIFEGRGGQNCQLQMPMVHKHPYGCIAKSLCKYVVRNNSHCRTEAKDFKRRTNDLKEIWINTIQGLKTADEKEKQKLIKKVERRMKRRLREHFWGRFLPMGKDVKTIRLFNLIPILKIKKGKYYLFGIFLLISVR